MFDDFADEVKQFVGRFGGRSGGESGGQVSDPEGIGLVGEVLDDEVLEGLLEDPVFGVLGCGVRLQVGSDDDQLGGESGVFPESGGRDPARGGRERLRVLELGGRLRRRVGRVLVEPSQVADEGVEAVVVAGGLADPAGLLPGGAGELVVAGMFVEEALLASAECQGGRLDGVDDDGATVVVDQLVELGQFGMGYQLLLLKQMVLLLGWCCGGGCLLEEERVEVGGLKHGWHVR